MVEVEKTRENSSELASVGFVVQAMMRQRFVEMDLLWPDFELFAALELVMLRKSWTEMVAVALEVQRVEEHSPKMAAQKCQLGMAAVAFETGRIEMGIVAAEFEVAMVMEQKAQLLLAWQLLWESMAVLAPKWVPKWELQDSVQIAPKYLSAVPTDEVARQYLAQLLAAAFIVMKPFKKRKLFFSSQSSLLITYRISDSLSC